MDIAIRNIISTGLHREVSAKLGKGVLLANALTASSTCMELRMIDMTATAVIIGANRWVK